MTGFTHSGADPIMIDHTMRGPGKCPTCNSLGDDLVVATDPPYRVEPTPMNPRPRVEFVGYDCRNCGQRLRFYST